MLRFVLRNEKVMFLIVIYDYGCCFEILLWMKYFNVIDFDLFLKSRKKGN